MDAFATHGLQGVLSEKNIEMVNISADYQLMHALALLACTILEKIYGSKFLNFACAAFVAGMLLFCGGLYIAALADFRAIMPIVPVGGVSFLAGWAALAYFALRRPDRE